MADKPSRALVLYGDGLARFIEPWHTQFHSLASKALCGFLGLPNSPPSESEDERIVREFAVLLDACEPFRDMTKDADSLKKSISERFMGMKAAILTSNASLKSVGVGLGCTIFQLDDLSKNKDTLSGSQVDCVASELLKLLGFEGGKTLEKSEFDVVFVHMGAGEILAAGIEKNTSHDMEFVNALIGSVMRESQPGSEIGSRLHLSVVMSYGSMTPDDDLSFSVSTAKESIDSKFSVLYPRQSYTMKGETPRNDIRHHSPMLIAQWQYAVTRKDTAETFSFEEFKKHGGNLLIPADRFLHEIAFKLWKAPKYGA